MEKTGCKIICGTPTIFAVKGLMMMIMMMLTHTAKTQAYLLWVWWKQKKRKWWISRLKRRGRFSLLTWKRGATWHAWQKKKRVPDDRSDILKGYLPKSPPAHPWDTENPSIWGWTLRTRRRIEMKQLRDVWRSCTRDNVEKGKSYVVMNSAADRQPMEIKT